MVRGQPGQRSCKNTSARLGACLPGAWGYVIPRRVHAVHMLCAHQARAAHVLCAFCAHAVRMLCTCCARAAHTLCTRCPFTRCPGYRGVGTPCDGSRANSWAPACRACRARTARTAGRARSGRGTSGWRLEPRRRQCPCGGGGKHGAAQHGTADAPTLRLHRPRCPRRLRRLHCRAAQPVVRVVVWEPPGLAAACAQMQVGQHRCQGGRCSTSLCLSGVADPSAFTTPASFAFPGTVVAGACAG